MNEDRTVKREGDRHQVLMVNRLYAEISGVINIESFDAREFVLQTTSGMMSVRGDNLHIRTLNLENGLVTIEGGIFDIAYLDEGFHPGQKAKGLMSRLFK
ncbi:MAG: sporulation protein YabP [Firmicutes bacterium]|nr:sporulation protein YabP [Bacillota bacterium]